MIPILSSWRTHIVTLRENMKFCFQVWNTGQIIIVCRWYFKYVYERFMLCKIIGLCEVLLSNLCTFPACFPWRALPKPCTVPAQTPSTPPHRMLTPAWSMVRSTTPQACTTQNQPLPTWLTQTSASLTQALSGACLRIITRRNILLLERFGNVDSMTSFIILRFPPCEPVSALGL